VGLSIKEKIMKTIYYLFSGQESLYHLVTAGRMPDIIEEKQLVLIKNLKDIKGNAPSIHHSFVLKLDLPKKEVEETYLITKLISSSENKPDECRCNQIDPSWISSIIVFSKQGENIVNRLLNNELKFEIELEKNNIPKGIDVTKGIIKQNLFKKHFIFSENKNNISTNKEDDNWIYLKKGDLLGSNVQTLVNTVNCVGVMGKGIAYGFKCKYLDMFKEYKKLCDKKQIKMGQPYLYKVSDERWIINFPTKNHWKNSSKLSDIEDGLKYLAKNLKEWGVTSIAIPPLGCGNGGLNWDDVRPLIEKYLKPIGIKTEIYVPTAFENTLKNNKRPSVYVDPVFGQH
jgi:O-acetyl-ADP-ribose deacetylase (regulator of RNase III)